MNVAATRPRTLTYWTPFPTGAQGRREGQMLSLSELEALATACDGPHGELIMILGLEGLRWGEVAGLQVGDRVSVPDPGLRLSRAVLCSNGGGALYVDTVKNYGWLRRYEPPRGIEPRTYALRASPVSDGR